MVCQWIDIGVCVYVSNVAYIIALRLHPVDKFEFIKKVMPCSVTITRVEGAIKRYFCGVWSTVDTAIGVIVVEAGPSPGIICLIGCYTGLEQQVFVSAIVAYHEEDEALVA